MVKVHLADGSFFVLHAEVFATGGIAAGSVIDEARVEELTARSQRVLARDAALRLLSRAAQTRSGLTRKLRARGFSAQAAGAAVERMIELGYLNDRAFAESWARFRLSGRKEGWRSLYRGLVRNGIPRSLAEEVLSSVCTEEVELEGARNLVRGMAPKAAASRLTSRGFRSRTIARILSEMRRAAWQGTEE